MRYQHNNASKVELYIKYSFYDIKKHFTAATSINVAHSSIQELSWCTHRGPKEGNKNDNANRVLLNIMHNRNFYWKLFDCRLSKKFGQKN